MTDTPDILAKITRYKLDEIARAKAELPPAAPPPMLALHLPHYPGMPSLPHIPSIPRVPKVPRAP